MKKSKNLLIVAGIILALIIGFLAGISVDYPNMNREEISGTIGKVDNYRNSKASDADIKLQNEILADSSRLTSMKSYFTFYYVQAAHLEKNIQFALEQANNNVDFKTGRERFITSLDSYNMFLNRSRQDMLILMTALQSVKEINPLLMRDLINKGSNIVAQMNNGNKLVLAFITELDSYIQATGADQHPGLNKAHDLLTYTEVGSALAINDKVILKYLDQKKMYCKNIDWDTQKELKETIQKDIEVLGLLDLEKLGLHDAEKLGFFDMEKLGDIVFTDAEKLGAYELDVEKLGTRLMDTEKLGSGIMHDQEDLDCGFWDTEKLGMSMDAEELGFKI